MTGPSLVRDFIYLDMFRVRSFASQLGEGHTESRRIERGGRLETTQAKASETSGATSETRLIEERLLLDHTYNELERRLSPNPPEKGKAFSPGAQPLIKVTGTVEIEDFKELSGVLANYNEIGKVIAGSTFKPRERFTTEKQRDNALAAHARESGLAQDPLLLKNLQLMLGFLKADEALSFIFDCLDDTGYVVRAVIDRTCLRYREDFLRTLYANASTLPWTVVGIPTFAPTDEPAAKRKTYEVTDAKMPDGTPNLGAAYRNMFRASQFLTSSVFRTTGEEIVILPLAVYRELQL